ncbi:hypothetical protein H8K35_02780 [Undibacterium sp. LX40W]|uniref:Uncharacterized protein n=1 Tax=Undibacterium nitidum TaxID=2762298 RepID=A0A923HV59_9BURK|nr:MULTISPECIES: hypothetical protein [Undibacterium]MBC3880691.1 hypothetical protein [Undibacterium nitidum]MBC3890574.1 hypothetical protein [Undibacterium sp. LX40W]
MRVLKQVILSCIAALISFHAHAQLRSHLFELSRQSIEYTTAGSDRKAAARMLVFDALAQDLPWSRPSFNHAAVIFQHTNTEHEPDDGELYRSQEMHLLTFFLLKEEARLNNSLPRGLLGTYRYVRVMDLPKELNLEWVDDPLTQILVLAVDNISDEERLRRGFPFALLKSSNTLNPNPLDQTLRTHKREQETEQLYIADQQTRSLFKKEEMIFNRYIERVGDAQRRARLYEMTSEDVLWDAKTLYRAAVVLNDTPSTIKRKAKPHYQLQENHLLAFFFARQAFLKGEHKRHH